jgi:ATP-dependent Lon protease
VIEDSAIRELVRRYTREAGVRNLEREMSKICRKVVKEAVLGQSKIHCCYRDRRKLRAILWCL